MLVSNLIKSMRVNFFGFLVICLAGSEEKLLQGDEVEQGRNHGDRCGYM